MIIRKDGSIVGLLDNKTLEEAEVTSETLRRLLSDMREFGIQFLGPSGDREGEQQDDADSSDGIQTFSFDRQNLEQIEESLIAAGFDVQIS